MTNVMLGAYPDVFRGGAPVAGVPYKCATKVPQTGQCNNGTMNKTPVQWGDLVRGVLLWTGPWPKVSIWHGTADVHGLRTTTSMRRWSSGPTWNGIDQTPDTT